MNHGVRHKPPSRHHRPLGWAMLGAAACIASALAEPAPISPSNLLTPAQPLTPVDQRFQDLNPLATSLRSLPTDLRQPSNFDRVYRVRTPGGAQDEQFARVSGALTALFPRSEYTQTKRGARADVPAGTIFYIGGLPHAGPGRIGDDVIRVAGLRKAYGDKVVHRGLDLLVRRGERWAVMGENGAGKTTLLKMVAGVLNPDAGEVTVGASVTLGYFAQHQMEQLDGTATVIDELQSHAPTTGIGVLRNLAGAFGFHGDDVEKPVRVLSGGERSRLVLAKLLFDAPNLLVLDEPTNHLDIATKRALVKALSSYQGTLLFVSHDRAFLRAIATRVLELTSNGPHIYGGTYAEYVSATGHEAPGMRTN